MSEVAICDWEYVIFSTITQSTKILYLTHMRYLSNSVSKWWNKMDKFSTDGSFCWIVLNLIKMTKCIQTEFKLTCFPALPLSDWINLM